MKLFQVILTCFLTGFSTAQYSVSVERPCPMETVTFTCTAPGDSLRWVPSDSTSISILSTLGLNVPVMQSGYIVTLIAANDTALTSTLSRIAKNGITVSCEGFVFVPTPSLTTIGSSIIQLVDLPGPPSTIRHSILSSSANEINVTVGWNPPSETGGRDDLTYTVTISTPAQLSATVLTSTSVTVTAQYNVDYTVSVVATNCAGNSTTVEYNFRIGGCPVLTNPTNGMVGPVSSRLPGSTVTIQCDAGYVSPVMMVTCDDSTLMWSPNAETIECGPLKLTQAPPTTDLALLMNCTAPSLALFTGTDLGIAVSISVVFTAVLFTIIGFLARLLVTHFCHRKKAMYSPAADGQANTRSTAPVGPVYEEVSPKEEIELNTNHAYGPVGL